MKKTFLYRFFGLGKIPAAANFEYAAEGIVLADEGFKGTATFRNFRSPQRITNWKRQWITAAIVLTNVRLAAFQYSAPIIDVPLADARFRELQFACEPDGAMLVRFDASLFHRDWSGTIEYRFFTPLAKEFLSKLTEQPK
jgi:hypothetical protein